MLGRIFLNSCKERGKDGLFLWDVEELTSLKSIEWGVILKEIDKDVENFLYQIAFL